MQTPPDRPYTARFIFLDPNATEFFRDYDKAVNDTVALLRAEADRDHQTRAGRARHFTRSG
jgi:hypothetical protein